MALISLTQFYRELTPAERIKYEAGELYTDHPGKIRMRKKKWVGIAFMRHDPLSLIDAFDIDLLKETIRSVLSGKPTTVPEWDASNHTR